MHDNPAKSVWGSYLPRQQLLIPHFVFGLLRARPKAERVHRQLAEIFHIERPGPTRPDRDALWRLISLEPCIRLGRGLLYWIAPSFNKWVRPVPLHLGGNNSTWHVLREGCQESSTCYYSTMAGPIGLKLGMQAGTHKIIRVRVSGVGCYSTCTRARGASRSRERLGPLRSNLVRG